MKSFIVAACIVACVYATSTDQAAQVLRSDYEQSPEGGFQYAYETDNGISGQATGSVKAVGNEAALEIKGENSFKSPEGEVFSLRYIANEFGYQPEAAYLPTPPAPQPIPEYIARALVWAAAHPYDEKKQL